MFDDEDDNVGIFLGLVLAGHIVLGFMAGWGAVLNSGVILGIGAVIVGFFAASG